MLFNKIHIVLTFLSLLYFHYSQGQENHIPKFNGIINLDGKLDESIWKNGYLITYLFCNLYRPAYYFDVLHQ